MRREARRSLATWARVNGFEPALHHRYIIRHLEDVVAGTIDRLIILVPPGAAKSTYTSVLFPPWYLASKPGRTILACSYSKDLITGFGRRCRNLVDTHTEVLKYELCKDSKAADEWETTNGGRYFCAGVGGGIAGHRADLAFIDDYLGTQEDADSPLIREKQWMWFWGDFWPRLKPGGAIIIIANRRHEDDLVGRLLDKEPGRWTVIRLPMLAEEGDPLGRAVGERLWPEWFTPEMVATAKQVSRIWAGLYQQRPAPEEGDYFLRAWLKGYEPQDLPRLTDMRVYAGGDFAISQERGANHTAFVVGGVDEKDDLYILPDIYWDYVKPEAPDRKIDSILQLCKRNNPQIVWAEKGHISKSLRPFIDKRMQEMGFYVYIDEVTPVHDKQVRAQAFRARCAQGKVYFPKFAPWWGDAEHDLLTFPGGKNDDIVDAFGHLGNGLALMEKPRLVRADVPPMPPIVPEITIDWIKQSSRRNELVMVRSNDDL